MNPKFLSIKYLTNKAQAIQDLKNILQPTWPNLLISQIAKINDIFSEPRTDLIIIDPSPPTKNSVEEIIANAEDIPVIVITDSKDIKPAQTKSTENSVQFLTPKEFKSPALVHSVSYLIERRELLDLLKSTTEQLQELTTKDDLTNLYNKRYIDSIINTEFKKAQRYKNPISALMIGIDDLRTINETYGYDTGNKILYEFAIIIQNALREVDIVARLNGDEFIAILPATDMASSINVAERILQEIHNNTFAGGTLTHNPTASIGIAEYSAIFRIPDEWVNALRKALLGAKHAGKDRLCTIEDSDASSHQKLTENTQIIMELQNQIHQLTEETKKSYFNEITHMMETMPFYKKYMVPHAERVAFYAEKLAAKIGMQTDEIAAIKRGGQLHDLGKVAIDKSILLKNGNLSSNESELVKQHPVIGVQIIGHSIFWKNELAMMLHHHEWFDGRGYPDKLHGTHIPLGARILAIAEAWDTMTSDQPYRPSLPLDKAINEIKQNYGAQFDPELASTFIAMIEG